MDKRRVAPVAGRRRYAWLARLYDLTSGEPVYRAGRRLGIDALRLRPGQCVLDVGCGTGLNFPLLAERVGAYGRIIGLDASAAMLRQARHRVERAGWENVRLLEADAMTVDLGRLRKEAGGPVDAALTTYALSLMPDWSAAWRRMHEVVRPGGRLAVVDLQRPDGPANLLAPVARLAALLGGADIDAHPWTAVESDCTDVTVARAWGGHLQVRVGTRPPADRD
jgi:S-adenosylmethionine-diacylgycerolhomoserine-N-methlytransferase